MNSSDNVAPIATYAYNTKSGIWTEWQFADAVITGIPLVSYTVTDDSRIGKGILATGEVIYFIDNFTPYDGLGSSGAGYIDSDYIDATYYVGSTTATTSPMEMIIRLDNWDNDNRNWKFAHSMRFVGDETESSQMLTIKWNNENNLPANYTHSTTIDIGSANNKATRLGRFKSRSHEFVYQGTEQIRFEGIDLDVSEGTH